MGAGGFAVVGDGGHELVGAAEPVDGRAQAGEVVHECVEEPAGTDADHDLGPGLADGAQGGCGHFLGVTEKAVLAVRPVSERVRALTPVSLTGPRMRLVAVTPVPR